MSGSRTKKLRAKFEAKNGFYAYHRLDGSYKYYWRKFKKEFKNR